MQTRVGNALNDVPISSNGRDMRANGGVSCDAMVGSDLFTTQPPWRPSLHLTKSVAALQPRLAPAPHPITSESPRFPRPSSERSGLFLHPKSHVVQTARIECCNLRAWSRRSHSDGFRIGSLVPNPKSSRRALWTKWLVAG